MGKLPTKMPDNWGWEVHNLVAYNNKKKQFAEGKITLAQLQEFEEMSGPMVEPSDEELQEIENKVDDMAWEDIEWNEKKSLGVVIAAEGYPSKYEINKEIKNIPSEKEDLKVFHAGTRFQEDSLTSNGGRVMCVTALGSSIQSAQKKVYNAISEIAYEDAFYRKDIGYRAIDREKEK